MKIKYQETPEFKKDFKKLSKRYRTLPEDLKIAKEAAIELRHLHNIDNLSTLPIPGFNSETTTFWKIKKFACKSLKGTGKNSGIRIIYALNKDTITFLEIYFKGDQANENKKRIKDHLKFN